VNRKACRCRHPNRHARSVQRNDLDRVLYWELLKAQRNCRETKGLEQNRTVIAPLSREHIDREAIG
jgi:hypothetical protein